MEEALQQLAARLAQVEQQNQQLQAQLQAQPPPPVPIAVPANQPKLPRPERWDGKGDMTTRVEISSGADGPTPMEVNTVQEGQPTRFNGTCFNCGKQGHKASQCRQPRKPRPAQQSKN